MKDHFLLLQTKLEDGLDGYPGNRQVDIVYTLTQDNVFCVEASMQTDMPTFFDPTHHGYFNLAGHDAGFIEDHRLMIPA